MAEPPASGALTTLDVLRKLEPRIAGRSGRGEASQAMKISSSSPRLLRTLTFSVSALVLSQVMSQRARASGGLWSSQDPPVHQAADEIIFVDNPGSTLTAIIRINYAGPAQRFAWLIPVPGKPTVAVSSSTVFQRLDAATAPQYWLEVGGDGSCMRQDAQDAGSAQDYGTAGAPSAPGATTAPIVVIDQGSVDPYDYVDIAVDPTLDDPAQAATDWLTSNGYDLTSLDSEVLSPYLRDGLNLLAFKLESGTDTGAIRPVMLSYESALPTIPIKPAAVSAPDGMGIQVWVFGPSQAVPDNYKSLVLNDALIDWLSGRKYPAGTLPAGGGGPFGTHGSKPSNYDAVVSAAVHEAGGRGFVTELGAPASQFRDSVWSTVDDQQLAMISSRSYADGIDALLAASAVYGGWDGWKQAVEGATTLPAGVTIDELGRNPDQYRGVAEVDTAKLFQLLQDKVTKPVADTAATLYQAPYLTRLYTSMGAGEMTVDPVFNYNADLAQVSNVHVAKQLIQCSSKLNRDDAPWRIELPQGGVITGKGSGDWPVAAGSLPANLEIVQLSTGGSGTLVEDNRDEIAKKLSAITGAGGSAGPALSPQNGLPIGGTQRLTPHPQAGSTRNDSLNPSGGGGCSISRASTRTGSAFGPKLALAAVMLALCWRRSLRAANGARLEHGKQDSRDRRATPRPLARADALGHSGSGGSRSS